jgi:hypothetical protein
VKFGGEDKKKVVALSALGVIFVVVIYTQVLSGPSDPAPAPRTSESGESSRPAPNITRASQPTPGRPARVKSNDFHPELVPKKQEDRIADLSKVDPTIRFDYMDKVLKVPQAGGARDLFQILKTPPVTKVAEVLKGPEPKLHPFVGPMKPAPPPPAPPPPGPKPVEPIPLRYFAYSTLHPDGKRTAFFWDGDEIVGGDEGQVLKKRYRIVKITVDRVLVEDTQQNVQQSLKIEPEITG